MREPFNLRPWEIEQLTDYQIARIYFHPTTEEGEIDKYAYAEQSKQFSYEEEFRYSWKQKGATDEEIDVRWVEVLKSKPKEE